MIVALDASPLSDLTQRQGVSVGDACRAWAESLFQAGHTIVIPAVADYEVRRELIRAKKQASIGRLDSLRVSRAFQFLPISDAALLRAASLWAEARQKGLPTAAPSELDCDVLLVAIVLTSGIAINQVTVATSNVGHLSRFLPAQTWQGIQP
jgi:predicted nucleic acid-binding protein